MKSGLNRSATLWLLFGLLAPILLVANVTVLGQLTPNYDPVAETVSIMGIPGQPYAWALNGGYVVYAALISVAAFGLFRSHVFPVVSRRASILLGVHAVGTVLLAVFPDSIDSMTEHVIHDAVSTLSYLPLLAGILVFRSASRQSRALKFAGIIGLAVVAANVPMPLVTMITPVKPFSGLLQRVLAGAAFCWLAGTFAVLYRKRGELAKTPTQLA